MKKVTKRKAKELGEELHNLCEDGEYKEVKQLIQSGADVNYKDEYGVSCLHVASRSFEQQRIVELLIANGADIEATDNSGETPLHAAANSTFGELEACKVLLSKGANVMCKNDDGCTPLHLASKSCGAGVLGLLISKGAEINQKDNDGNTPLHTAIMADSVESAQVLILHGSDIFSKYKKRKTPLDLAISRKRHDIVSLLLHQIKLHNSELREAATKALSWTEADVKKWMKSLKLSKSYASDIRSKNINGIALLCMRTAPDWKKIGIESEEDCKILKNAPNPLRFSAQTAPSFAKKDTSHSGPPEAPKHVPQSQSTTKPKKKAKLSPSESRSKALDGLGEVTYKPLHALMRGYFPPSSCEHHILTDLPSVLTDVKDQIPDIVKESLAIAHSCLERLPSKLSKDEALAVVTYSYDIYSLDPSKNLYFVLNKVLRERNPHKMRALLPFLYYLMNGLSKLPPVKATVFRGIPKSSMNIIKEKYLQGTTIHWSAFTSTTTNLPNAQLFSTSEGPGGVIFRISVLNGRNTQHCSAIQSEEEVLLSPNCKLAVVKAVHPEDDGYNYVDLAELQGENFVF